MPTYLDANGNPIPAAAPAQKQYLDPNTGEPIGATSPASPASSQSSPQPGFFQRLYESSPIPGAIAMASHPTQIPATVDAAFQSGLDHLAGKVGGVKEALHEGNYGAAAYNAATGVPFIGSALESMGDDVAMAHPNTDYSKGGGTTFGSRLADTVTTPGAMGTAVGTAATWAAPARGALRAAGAGAGDVLAGAAGKVASAGDAVADAANRMYVAKPTVPYTPAHASAFEGAISPATAMGKNFIPQEITPEALPAIRTTAARMATSGTPEEQAAVQEATSPKTPPLQRIKSYQDVVQGALNDLEAQHAPALQRVANVPVDTTPIVKQLDGLISNTTDPADVSAIRGLQARVKNAKTIGDLNTFRQELNTETAPEYKQSQVQAGRSGISAQATSDLSGWIRNAYYDQLQKATGTDFAPLKRQEANLLTTKEALQNQMAPLAKAEATFNAPSTVRETIGNVANVIKEPKTTVTQTLLRESPATRVATLLKKSLSDLPQYQAPPATPQPYGLLGAHSVDAGNPYTMQGSVPFSPPMTAGERSAALNQWLRQRRLTQLQLPAQASPIQLPPPQ